MTFINNEGTWDRAIRILLGIALGYAAWFTWPGTAGFVFLAIAAIAFVTAFVGWCPAYAAFGISTKKKVGA